MARYLICSDIHRNTDNFRMAVKAAGHIDGVFIAGDIECTEADLVSELHYILGSGTKYRTDFLFYVVAGNCDWGAPLPDKAAFDIAGGHRVFMAHGHRYSVPSLMNIERAAEDEGADIIIFGHTHNQMTVERDGYTFINPGALKGGYANAHYSILTVDDGGRITIDEYAL